LNVPEQKMCGNTWSSIDLTKLPSVCGLKFRKAFLNEQTGKAAAALTPAQEATGNRYPEREDRVECRKRLREAVCENKIGGKQLHPHEIVKEIMNGSCSTLELEMFNSQWTSLRRGLVESLEKARREQESASDSPSTGLDFNKVVPLVDVSGSMSGIPMLVAIALGILTSEVNHEAFRDGFITFHENPTWVSLKGARSIAEKVEVTSRAPWGESTDLDKAFDLILNTVESQRLGDEDVPDLIIFSDMQFNDSLGREAAWDTQLDRIGRKFRDAGLRVHGKPYRTPRIVFWNLRGDTYGYPAQADSENVQMLSGFSPSLLEVVLSGAPLPAVVAAVAADDADDAGYDSQKPKTTPLDTLRKVLDNAKYDVVRIVLDASTEGLLAAYHFSPPVSAVELELERAEDWEVVETASSS
jgi:Mg-chelatase subunit ChlD